MARQRQIRMCREGLYYSVIVLAVLIGAIDPPIEPVDAGGQRDGRPAGVRPVLRSPGFAAPRRSSASCLRQLHADQRLVVDVSVTNCRRWLGIWAIEVQDVVGREEALRPGERSDRHCFFPERCRPRNQASHLCGPASAARALSLRSAARLDALSRWGSFGTAWSSSESEELMVHPKLGRLTRDWAQIARENRGRRPAHAAARIARSRLLRIARLAHRRQPSLDSLADFRPARHARRAAVRAAPQPGPGAAGRSVAAASIPTQQDLENVETAVSFVATLIAEACRQSGRQLVLALAAREPLCHSGPASPVFFREQMDALSLAAAHNESEFPDSLGRALAMVPGPMSTLIVSTRADRLGGRSHARLPSAMRRWRAGAARLERRPAPSCRDTSRVERRGIAAMQGVPIDHLLRVTISAFIVLATMLLGMGENSATLTLGVRWP